MCRTRSLTTTTERSARLSMPGASISKSWAGHWPRVWTRLSQSIWITAKAVRRRRIEDDGRASSSDRAACRIVRLDGQRGRSRCCLARIVCAGDCQVADPCCRWYAGDKSGGSVKGETLRQSFNGQDLRHHHADVALAIDIVAHDVARSSY